MKLSYYKSIELSNSDPEIDVGQSTGDALVANRAKQSTASTASSKASLRNQPIQEESESDTESETELPSTVVRPPMLANAATKAAQARAGEDNDEDTLRPEELTEKPSEKPAPSKHEAQSNKPQTRSRAAATTGPAAQQQPAFTGNRAKDGPIAGLTEASRQQLGSQQAQTRLRHFHCGTQRPSRAAGQTCPSRSTAAGAAEKTVGTSDTNDGTDADRPKKKAAFRFTKLPRVALLANAPASREAQSSGATTSSAAAASRAGTKEAQRQLRGAAGPQQQAPSATGSSAALLAAISKRVPTPGTAPASAIAAHEGAQSTDAPAVQDDEPTQVKELRAQVRSLREQLAAQKLSENEREMKLRTEMANQFQQVFKDQQAQNLYVRIPTEYCTVS